MTIGHVDSGKSTIIGHLLQLCGVFDEEKMSQLEKDANEMGKKSYKFAWIIEKLSDNSRYGRNIELACCQISTPHCLLKLFDQPGNRNYARQLIFGIQQSDFAILVVSASMGEFEASIGCDSSVRQYSQVAYSMGIKHFVISVNKMDDNSVNYSQVRYNEVISEVGKVLVKIGFKMDDLTFVPVSAWLGDNLVQISPKMPWYNGPSLLDALDNYRPCEQKLGKPFLMPVQDVFCIAGAGVVAVGRVAQGQISIGQKVTVSPYKPDQNHTIVEVTSIESDRIPINSAQTGDYVGICFKNIQKTDIKRGCIVGSIDDPPKIVRQFRAQIQFIDYIKPFSSGFHLLLSINFANIEAKIEKIIAKVDQNSKESGEKQVNIVRKQDRIECVLSVENPVVLMRFEDNEQFGRFVLIEKKQVFGIGTVLEVLK